MKIHIDVFVKFCKNKHNHIIIITQPYYSNNNNTNISFSLNQKTITDVNTTKRTCDQVDFAVPLDRKVEIKENEKIDKYFNLAGN